MYDPNLTNVTGNSGRGTQNPSNAFSSLGNLFGGGGSSGVGSAPMNAMPQNASQQPGYSLHGMLGLLANAFGGGSNFQNYMGNSWNASPLGQMFGAQRQQMPQQGAREQYNSTRTGIY
jgi:hypothetical protein